MQAVFFFFSEFHEIRTKSHFPFIKIILFQSWVSAEHHAEFGNEKLPQISLLYFQVQFKENSKLGAAGSSSKTMQEPTVASSTPAAKPGGIGAIAPFSITLRSPLLKLYWHFIWFRINCYRKPFCFSNFSFRPLITVKLYKRPLYSLTTVKRFFFFFFANIWFLEFQLLTWQLSVAGSDM